MLDSIEQAVKSHDRYQVEVKLDYELQPGKKTSYEISTYIFIPPTLGIHPDTYGKTEFYRDIKNHVRFKTPELTLRDFTDHAASPLILLRNFTADARWTTDPAGEERVIRGLKLVSIMLKVSVREHLKLIYRRINEAGPAAKLHMLVGNLVQDFTVEARKISAAFRDQYSTFNQPNVSKEVFAAYQYADEYLSLLIEDSATEIYSIVNEHLGKKGEKAGFKEALTECAQFENRYRRSQGYDSLLKVDDLTFNEEYTIRTSALKKYASSVLYLTTDRKVEGQSLRQVLYAMAAGISMIFATVVAFVFQQRYGAFTFPLFAALVVGYMFKDRIKEIVRGFLANYLQARLYDHRIVIRAQGERAKLGVLKEKMTFIDETGLPNAIRRRREMGRTEEVDRQPEVIICHSKEIVLYREAFEKPVPGMLDLTGVNDITRYDIRAILRKMAEPEETVLLLDETGLTEVITHRVYRVNFISKYKSVVPEKEKAYSRIRLILTQDGIKRVEHIDV